ncbi:DUF3237 family protein [Microbacterium sp. NPDC077184]|uniref:DUF3237 family protein n=1 Tax=Microbacterium sp. NPDC077184 TaxID=3154764 RepID=UPI0034369E14
MTSTAPPALRFAFRITALVGEYLPLEQRGPELLEFIPITGGTVEGDVTGEIIPGGGDWCLTRADDAYRVEARYLFRTLEGHVVDVVNVGILRHLEGETGSSKEMRYFLTTPVFRTTAASLQWLTRSVFIGRADARDGATVIDVFEVLS